MNIKKIKCFFGFHQMKTLWTKSFSNPLPAFFVGYYMSNFLLKDWTQK